MRRSTNKQVVKAFLDGRNAQAGSLSSVHLPATAQEPPRGYLRSYNQVIARYEEGAGFIVFDFTSAGEYISQTTSSHVGLIKRELPSKCVMHPQQARLGGLLGGR